MRLFMQLLSHLTNRTINQKSNMADLRWPPFDNHDVIATSFDVITSYCGPQKIVERTISPPSLIVIAFIRLLYFKQSLV